MDVSPTKKLNKEIEARLSGGHPNSLGNVPDVTSDVLADQRQLLELLSCYNSNDPVVRLRVSSVLKRVCQQRPEWVMPYLDHLLNEVAKIDQASTKWTLAIIFGLLREQMNSNQHKKALDLLRAYLSYQDWIVQNTAMKVLYEFSSGDEELSTWLRGELVDMQNSKWRSVASRAKKLLAIL